MSVLTSFCKGKSETNLPVTMLFWNYHTYLRDFGLGNTKEKKILSEFSASEIPETFSYELVYIKFSANVVSGLL